MTLEEAKKIRFCNGRGYSTIEFIQALQLTEEIKNNNTMTQENKQLLLKDLSARLSYGVKCKLWSYDNESSATTVTIKMSVLDAFIYNNTLTVKPYLRPMSSMTDEERRFLLKFGTVGMDENDKVFDVYPFGMKRTIPVIDFLNAHHFDIRNLIEKGLALEAPEGMYKTE